MYGVEPRQKIIKNNEFLWFWRNFSVKFCGAWLKKGLRSAVLRDFLTPSRKNFQSQPIDNQPIKK
jgi:hypothetical protein